MNPLVSIVLFTANLLALSITLSVLILAYAQRPGDSMGNAVIQFLAVLAFYNLAVMLDMAVMIFNFGPYLQTITTNLTVAGFALSIVAAFSLLVSLAGMMHQVYQLAARAGFVMFILLQWPLWTGQFFAGDSSYSQMLNYTPAGLVAGVTGLLFILLTFAFIWVYHNRLGRGIIFGVVLFLCGQVLAITASVPREIGLASLMSVAATAVLGYGLAKMQLFNPLTMHMSQLAALRDVSRALTGNYDVQQVLDAVVQQARRAIRTDLALMVLRDDSARTLHVVAQDGGKTNLVGRDITSGTGLSSQIFDLRTSMRLQNYQAWDNQSPVFADIPVNAILGVPLTYADDVVGVLIVCELKAGRTFSARDEAMLEMLAPQASASIVNARLRQRVATLSQNSAAAGSQAF
jgi:GAF domain